MYNIVTVCNKSYQEFLIYFVNSLIVNCDLQNVNKLYIVNNGIDQHIVNTIAKKSNKIFFLNNQNTDYSITGSGWSKEWGYNVDIKTPILSDIIRRDKLPAFLMDVDCFFIKNFESLIDFNKDVILCDRESKYNRMIGSFAYFNNTENSLMFLNHWIYEQSLIKKYPKETYCLNKTYYLLGDKINISSLSFKLINFYYTPSSEKERDDRCIVHLKGQTEKDTFEEEIKNRINRLSCFVDINQYNK